MLPGALDRTDCAVFHYKITDEQLRTQNSFIEEDNERKKYSLPLNFCLNL
jgi:hypothetical protein